MRKHIFGKQLSRDINERKALFRGLINALVMEERIQTTEAKAKSIRGEVEKLITKAKRKKEAARSLLQPWLQKDALEKVMKDLSVRFASRPGGYTRIISLGERFGDNAKMAVIEFVEKSSKALAVNEKTKENKKSAKNDEVEAEVRVQKEKTKSPKSPKKEKPTKKEQRPPSKAEMEKRKAGE